MRPLTHAMSQSAKQKDSEIILTFTENEDTRVSSDFCFKKLTAKGVILYFLVPRNLSDYVKHEALWDCKRREKSRPYPLRIPSCLRLSRTSTRDRERLAMQQNCTRQVFFTFVSNYDKFIANEARNTSFLYLLELSFLKLNAHKVGAVLGLGHFRFLKKEKINNKINQNIKNLNATYGCETWRGD